VGPAGLMGADGGWNAADLASSLLVRPAAKHAMPRCALSRRCPPTLLPAGPRRAPPPRCALSRRRPPTLLPARIGGRSRWSWWRAQ
jgi:hypothetical protein